jgi:hypothetical protein
MKHENTTAQFGNGILAAQCYALKAKKFTRKFVITAQFGTLPPVEKTFNFPAYEKAQREHPEFGKALDEALCSMAPVFGTKPSCYSVQPL